MSQLFTSGGQNIGALPSAALLLMNTQGWFPLGLTSLTTLLSKGLSRVFSRTTVWKHKFFSAQPSFGPTLTFIHDYWKSHSFDYMDLCWQSDIFAFVIFCIDLPQLLFQFHGCSQSAVILETKKRKYIAASISTLLLKWGDGTRCHDLKSNNNLF